MCPVSSDQIEDPPGKVLQPEKDRLISSVTAVRNYVSSLPAAARADPFFERFLRNHFNEKYLGLPGEDFSPFDTNFLQQECGIKLKTLTAQIDMLLKGVKETIQRLKNEGVDWIIKVTIG